MTTLYSIATFLIALIFGVSVYFLVDWIDNRIKQRKGATLKFRIGDIITDDESPFIETHKKYIVVDLKKDEKGLYWYLIERDGCIDYKITLNPNSIRQWRKV